MKSPPKSPEPDSAAKRPAESETARRDRQAQLLRENLRRRKEQARGRQSGDASSSSGEATADGVDN